MKTVEIGNGIKQSFGAITVDSVGPNQYNQDKWQAQIRQEVSTIYPAARPHDSLSDGIFDASSFGEGQTYIEKRVTWVPVPKGTTAQQVQARLKQTPDAVLHKTLSLKPILSEEQVNAMSTGLSSMTEDDYAEKAVKDANGNIVLYANQFPQYRSIKFKRNFAADTDLRSADYDELTGRIQMAESAPVGQTVKSF